MEGNITVPGFAKPSEECPSDLLEKEPEPPRLNLLPQRKDLYPAIPDAVLKDLPMDLITSELLAFSIFKITNDTLMTYECDLFIQNAVTNLRIPKTLPSI